ncbi:undecaprenyl-diphosphatase [Paenibacillus sp. BK033]|uniref:undecaprenyl-diphosphatase n=1 Tax=Paenibacillus sp. BK033 TaxID=2512133 RepID=UPI0010494807|nr:undecaprenyl-diphosphatase [Paenibacillus sp. BK033]TCM99398.1 undecaprenyl-diphosphatase [Paenibacillus sp. BK033]
MNEQLFHIINNFAGRFDWIDDLMEIFAQDIVWLMLAILVFLWCSGSKENQRAVFFACLTAAVSLLLAAWVISPLVNHPRPFVDHTVHQLISHAADASFPSDHATLAFSFAFVILLMKRQTGVLMLVFAVLTGISRIYVGVHYPADILGAVVLSFLIALTVFALRKQIDPISRLFISLYNQILRVIPVLSRFSKS